MRFSPLTSRKLLQATLAVVLVVFLGGYASSEAVASIVQPDDAVTDFDQLLAQIDESSTSSSGASSSSTTDDAFPFDRDEQTPQDKNHEIVELLAAAPVEGTSSSTSTSTSSSSSGSGGTPIYTLSASTCPNLALVGWVQGEARFSLPMPPGNDLLRPPQS